MRSPLIALFLAAAASVASAAPQNCHSLDPVAGSTTNSGRTTCSFTDGGWGFSTPSLWGIGSIFVGAQPDVITISCALTITIVPTTYRLEPGTRLVAAETVFGEVKTFAGCTRTDEGVTCDYSSRQEPYASYKDAGDCILDASSDNAWLAPLR
jgi:hypothetical protein